jgi:hypothetical protein
MKKERQSTMLECWRPPTGAGDPVGCIAATFTFDPNFFEEECLSRFLNIDSHPDREGLAFLLERENLLGSLYAGVFIDHRQAGVDHSLRWDVLPVRIPGRYQHAKIAVLAWANYIRILVSSANLTPAGYRNNQEIVGFIDLSPKFSDHQQLDACCLFLNELIKYVPCAGDEDHVLIRAKIFIKSIQNNAKTWIPTKSRKHLFNSHLIFTVPNPQSLGQEAFSTLNGGVALNGCLDTCIKFGAAPSSIGVVSPFFNQEKDDGKRDEVTAQLCKRMARGTGRTLTFCLPRLNDEETETYRLAAPKSLYTTAIRQLNTLNIETLPSVDHDKNFRPWHAKMLRLENDNYAALMIGSSNYTSSAMGLKAINNAEANILYIIPQKAYARHIGQLYQCWPETTRIENIDEIEWTGVRYPLGEEDLDFGVSLPEGFVYAHFRAGDTPEICLGFFKEKLPLTWQIFGGIRYEVKVLDADDFTLQQCPTMIRIPWRDYATTGKLLVKWQDKQAFLSVNVENAHDLPLAPEIELMSIHELICILSAFDYSMAFRAWARKHQGSLEEEALECAIPAELDPLKRFRLEETFLHRTRTRARMLGGIRKNLERPAWSEKALRWRLEGIIGIKSLAEKLLTELETGSNRVVEAVLELADFFIMLSEVSYQESAGAITPTQFHSIYQPFLRNLLDDAKAKVSGIQRELPQDIRSFWIRICDQCLQ